jgi:hypothetical protein
MRRIVCRAPWSALAVTEQVFTTTTSASAAGAAMPPRPRSCSSMRSESAWLTRQPNVRMAYLSMRWRRTMAEPWAAELKFRPASSAGRVPCYEAPASFAAAFSTFSASDAL